MALIINANNLLFYCVIHSFPKMAERGGGYSSPSHPIKSATVPQSCETVQCAW